MFKITPGDGVEPGVELLEEFEDTNLELLVKSSFESLLPTCLIVSSVLIILLSGSQGWAI